MKRILLILLLTLGFTAAFGQTYPDYRGYYHVADTNSVARFKHSVGTLFYFDQWDRFYTLTDTVSAGDTLRLSSSLRPAPAQAGTVNNLGITVNGSYDSLQVQQIVNKLDELLNSLRNAKIIQE